MSRPELTYFHRGNWSVPEGFSKCAPADTEFNKWLALAALQDGRAQLTQLPGQTRLRQSQNLHVQRQKKERVVIDGFFERSDIIYTLSNHEY